MMIHTATRNTDRRQDSADHETARRKIVEQIVTLQIGKQTMVNVSLRDAAQLARMILGWALESGSTGTDIAIFREPLGLDKQSARVTEVT